jgi:3-oxoacyl-ACP reductase-like protein
MPKSTKPKPPRKPKAAARPAAKTAPADRAALAPDDRVLASNLTLHELFAQQTVRMLDRADLSDEQKQSLLIGMSCPCCGAGGFSFTAKLRRG